MYIELEEDATKSHYSDILEDTLRIAQSKISNNIQDDTNNLWISIINQIEDIREKIVEKHQLTDWEKIYERYTIGTIGLQYFEKGSEIRSRLCDIFYGAVHFDELKD